LPPNKQLTKMSPKYTDEERYNGTRYGMSVNRRNLERQTANNHKQTGIYVKCGKLFITYLPTRQYVRF